MTWDVIRICFVQGKDFSAVKHPTVLLKYRGQTSTSNQTIPVTHVEMLFCVEKVFSEAIKP